MQPHHGTTSNIYNRKRTQEAVALGLAVWRRGYTDLEKLFAQHKHPMLDMEIRMLTESIAHLDPSCKIVDPATVPKAEYSVTPQRGRRIIIKHHGELWASARWLHHHLESSVCFDSLTTWLGQYKAMLRRKLNVDGHIWLYHVDDFKDWRRRSISRIQSLSKRRVVELRV